MGNQPSSGRGRPLAAAPTSESSTSTYWIPPSTSGVAVAAAAGPAKPNFFTDAAACQTEMLTSGAEVDWSFKVMTIQDVEWIASALADPMVPSHERMCV